MLEVGFVGNERVANESSRIFSGPSVTFAVRRQSRITTMNTDHFWQIIEATRAATQEEQLELFRSRLERLSLQELIEFERIFVEHSFAAYSWDLWLVAWLCQGGMCSDDGFMDFRSWLISRGRASYEAALA